MTGCGENSNYENFVLTDVSIGSTTITNWGGGSNAHSVTWAYVYNGQVKIGIIKKSSMSMSGYSETGYSLEIGQNWQDAFTLAVGDQLDLSDMDETNKFTGDKK
ncbi:MAG: hypothetical protein LBD48_13585 [Treponema sp.]|nr:hypothetical protein [Treponema sp.]